MKKMKIEIFRKRFTPNGFVIDEKAETTIWGIEWFKVNGEYLYYAYIKNSCTPLTLHMDKFNYDYVITIEDGK